MNKDISIKFGDSPLFDAEQRAMWLALPRGTDFINQTNDRGGEVKYIVISKCAVGQSSDHIYFATDDLLDAKDYAKMMSKKHPEDSLLYVYEVCTKPKKLCGFVSRCIWEGDTLTIVTEDIA